MIPERNICSSPKNFAVYEIYTWGRTSTLAVWPNKELVVEGYTDTDYGGSLVIRRSAAGY